jgi:hypothetical protein
MRYPSKDQIVWTFDTARFRVVCALEPCEMDPADSFQYQEDIDAVREDRVLWFDAIVSVWFGEDEDLRYVAHDALGGCAYATVQDFIAAHRDHDPMARNSSLMRAVRPNSVICHYFPDMVRVACEAARAEVVKMQSVPMRAI